MEEKYSKSREEIDLIGSHLDKEIEDLNHREFRKEILQAMQVGVWALTQKIHFIEFYIYVQVGQS
ncbi:hypothetical protein AAGX58_13425, partial [Staphylococcus aureus]